MIAPAQCRVQHGLIYVCVFQVMTVYQVEAGVLALDGSRKSCLELRRLFHTSMSSYWQPVLLRTGPHGLAMQRCQVD